MEIRRDIKDDFWAINSISFSWESWTQSCFYSSLLCLKLHISSKFIQLLASLSDGTLEVLWNGVSQPTHKFVLEKLIVKFTGFGSDAGESSILMGYCVPSPGVPAQGSTNVYLNHIQGARSNEGWKIFNCTIHKQTRRHNARRWVK